MSLRPTRAALALAGGGRGSGSGGTSFAMRAGLPSGAAWERRRATMQLGMIGLGRMGANMVERLMKAGHDLVVYDAHADAVTRLAGLGATGASGMKDFVGKLAKPRAVWLMVPAAVVDPILAEVAGLLEPGDTVIDGGNSYYHDDIRRAGELKAKGLHYVDVGVSGGVWGKDRGYCHMIGGETEIVARLDPIFRALAPGV